LAVFSYVLQIFCRKIIGQSHERNSQKLKNTTIFKNLQQYLEGNLPESVSHFFSTFLKKVLFLFSIFYFIFLLFWNWPKGAQFPQAKSYAQISFHLTSLPQKRNTKKPFLKNKQKTTVFFQSFFF